MKPLERQVSTSWTEENPNGDKTGADLQLFPGQHPLQNPELQGPSGKRRPLPQSWPGPLRELEHRHVSFLSRYHALALSRPFLRTYPCVHGLRPPPEDNAHPTQLFSSDEGQARVS